MAYCDDDAVFTLGLAARAFVVRPRPFDAIDAATGTIRLKAHGLTADDVVTFEVPSGGALPAPGISAFAPFYPLVVSFDLIKVAALPAGPALLFTNGGSGWGIVVDPLRRIRLHAEQVSAEIDEHLTAHEPPIPLDPITGKYPPILVGLAARMTARAAVTSLQIENAQFRVAVDRLFAQEEFDKLLLADWKAGKPIQPRPTDQTPELADNSARAGSSRDAIDWQTGSL